MGLSGKKNKQKDFCSIFQPCVVWKMGAFDVNMYLWFLLL